MPSLMQRICTMHCNNSFYMSPLTKIVQWLRASFRCLRSDFRVPKCVQVMGGEWEWRWMETE